MSRALPCSGPWRGIVAGVAWLTAAAVVVLPGPAAAIAPPVRHRPVDVVAGSPAAVVLATRAAVTGVSARARTQTCARRHPVTLRLATGGRTVGRARLHGTGWRTLRFAAELPTGRHRILLHVRGARGCARAVVDELRLRTARVPDRPAGSTRRGPSRPIPVNAAAQARLATGIDPQLQTTFLESFDGLTPENEMKMGAVEPRRGAFAFAPADRLVDYALGHGKTVRGHTLVWHSQLPGWLTRQRWSRADMLGILHEWIAAIVGRYRGKVVDWDVLNELFDESGAWRTNSPWYQAIGPDLAEAALRAAHEADPGARLFINDFDIERPGPKQDAVFDLVRDLRARGVPIDGVGIQAHWAIGDIVPEATLLATMQRFASLGVRVEITELDVMTDHAPDALIRQAAVYAMAGRVCQAVAACDRITVWGISDRDSWRGAANRPLLFDDHFLRKPAYVALRDALDG